MASLNHPTVILSAVSVVALCAESWFSWQFLRRLKKEHSGLWLRSGRRTIWTDGDLISAFTTIKFLWKREYVPESQRPEIEFCESYRTPVVVSWALAAVSVLAFFVSFFAIGWPVAK